jgi:hypothetical protein
MPRPRNSTEMRPSMPARKRCPSLKAGLLSYVLRLAVFFPPRCGMHTTLTPFRVHDFTFVPLKKAAIGTVQFWGVAEGFLMAFQGRFHLLIVARVSLEHFVLCDQPFGAFREENLVAELDRGLRFATLDQIRVGFKVGIDLLGSGNLFSLEHATARLVSQFTAVVNLFPERVNELVVQAAVDLGVEEGQRLRVYPSVIRSRSSRYVQFLARIRTRERRTCCGVNPLRPVPGLFKPRSRSCRTASIISSWLSRKSQMLCSSGSSEMPCCSNS